LRGRGARRRSGNVLGLLGVFLCRGDRLIAGVDLVARIVNVFAVIVGRWFAAVAAPGSDRSPSRPCERARDGPCSPSRILLPEIARIVLIKLIADFVAPLVAVSLPITTVFNSIGPIL
jgi:hypothetical protein